MLGGWVLYIAVFDHKERTARVYTQGDTPTGFRTIESSIPAIDLEHGVLDTRLGRIIDRMHDPIVGVHKIRTLLEKHYQSIMAAITTMAEDRKYHIKNRWTMKRADTMSAAHEERGAASGDGVSTVNEATSRNASEHDRQYLEQGRVERMLGMLSTRRGKWVENYMALVMRETRERFEGLRTVVDEDTGGGKGKAVSDAVVDSEQEKMEELLIDEWHLMEVLLVYEVERWEEQLWRRRECFVGGSPEKQRLTMEWRGNCWKRLDANIRAMDARMDTAKTSANGNEFDVSWKWQDMRTDTQRAWQAVVKRFMERETSSSPPSIGLQRLEKDIAEITKPSWWLPDDGLGVEGLGKQCEEMASRLKRELEDVEERLNKGLDRCDQFWVGGGLLECGRSGSKTLFLQKLIPPAPLEVYSRALKQNKTATHIEFHKFHSDDDYRWIAETIRDLPGVTSISVPRRELLPAIDRPGTTPLFIDDDDYQDIEPFLKCDPHLADSNCQGTFVFVTWKNVVVSFVGPTSGDLILRLTHRSTDADATFKVEGTSLQLSLSSSLTVDDIPLHATPSESDEPSFKRGIRNNLIIQVAKSSYSAYDIQLLDQRGNCYNAASQSPEGVSAAGCVLLSIVIDPLIHHDLLQAMIKCHRMGG